LEECCVCLEKLYYGVKTPQRMRCGHSIHTQCMTVLLQNGDFRCPLCKKTSIDMDWDKYGKLLEAMTPSEESFLIGGKECSIMCNDCFLTATTTTTIISVYRCSGCGGYNTSQC
jgi:RING finger/CHY zinc finger protein 1